MRLCKKRSIIVFGAVVGFFKSLGITPLLAEWFNGLQAVSLQLLKLTLFPRNNSAEASKFGLISDR